MAFWKSLGPGILFAGAAIGTSHLVQSTRAGALYGLGLLVVVIGANLIKYPAYRFGPLYASATGTSLIDGYLHISRWILAVFVICQTAVTAIVIAASALVTAAIALAMTGLALDPRVAGTLLVAVGAAVLLIGGYPLLDRLSKVFVLALTVTTLAATAASFGHIDWSISQFAFPSVDIQTYAFIIALIGFMPAGMELSVIQSLWCVAKSRGARSKISRAQVLTDFNVGYIGSTMMAVCFLLMGTAVMHQNGVLPETQAAGFANQVIRLYTANLGDWAGVVVGISALFVMFTTLLTVMDGLPRLVAGGIQALRHPDPEQRAALDRSPLLKSCIIVLGIAGAAILLAFMRNFQTFIDFVTTTAFVVAPFNAVLNHVAVTSARVPAELQPGPVMRAWSWLGIAALSALSIAFFAWRFSGS